MWTRKPPPTDPPEAEPIDPPITDIGMARRAKVAEAENEKLKKIVEELRETASRHDGLGDLSADRAMKGHDTYRCEARAPGGGRHPLVLLTKDRTVECKVCGAELDAYDVLLSYAHGERLFSFHLTSLRKEVAELQVERDRLKAERSSLKSQVKRKAARRDEKDKESPPADRAEATAWAKELADSIGTEKSGK